MRDRCEDVEPGGESHSCDDVEAYQGLQSLSTESDTHRAQSLASKKPAGDESATRLLLVDKKKQVKSRELPFVV